jgi:type IV pilus assembly protein PilC
VNTYQYTIKDKDGNTHSGILDGVSEDEIAQILHSRELIVVSIRQIRKRTAKLKLTHKKVRLDDILIFSRQLATMINAGIPLVHALGILADQIENKNLKNVVIMASGDISAGMSFCNALNKHPAVFSDFFINMVSAGETSGRLDEVLDRVATYLEKTASITRKIRSSLVYPAVVISMAILITGALLLKVVPTFKNIFETLGGQLPLPTQILIMISDLFRRYFLLLIGLLMISGFLFKRYIATAGGRYNFDRIKLNAPILGQLFRKVAIAKFSRTFSTLTRSGVAILAALEIVSKTAGNKVIEEAVLDCSKNVRDGEPIAQPLSKSGVFPPMVCSMISAGEKTGQLEKMLSKVADFYDEQVDASATALTSMIEPLVIAFLGIVIGGIVISLFLPIFKITQLIGR